MTVPSDPVPPSPPPADDRAARTEQRIQAAEIKTQQAEDGRAATIEQRIQAIETKTRQGAEGIRAIDPVNADRSWIVRWIIGVFAGVIMAVLIFLVIQGCTTGDWSVVASSATDLFKSSVVPIVTLVLGFYFGNPKS